MIISTFKSEDHPSILAASKLVWSEGCLPHRVVLRKEGEQYITHMENLELEVVPTQDSAWKHRDFYWGHYFKDFAKAQADWLERIKKL